ncbi:MAG: lipopolysaccharide heptosyltransferase II [Methylacidiphilales bacterium]|nr:lipopolysaccharide heptosyltransferase II [Candidatus Methylacidiphilales bacterium]
MNGPVVVRSPNWLGDAVMALPAVRNLKTMIVRDPLAVAVPEKLAALWQICPFVDRVIILDQPKNLAASAKKLREGKFGAAILLPNSLRAAAEAWLAGIPQRIGYARGGRRLLLTTAIPVPERNPVRLHQRYYYQDLITALGGPVDPAVPELHREAVSGGSPFTVAICPGAEYGPAKRWLLENFLAVAKHFATKHHARIVLLGTPGDAPLAAEIARQLPGAEDRAGKTTLAEFLVALASSRLVVCNDSGAMHAASILGVPTVAVFGSTEPQLTSPLGPRTAILRHHVPCSPCFLRECPLDFACMKSITPEMAIAAAEKLI